MSTAFAHVLLWRDLNSPLSRGTIINIVTWVSWALVISTLIARFAVKLSRRTTREQVGKDDVLLALAAVRRARLLSFGQSIAVFLQWKDTEGERHLQSFYDGPIFQKTAYVFNILVIANMGCAKIFLSLFIRKLFAGRLFEYTSVIAITFTAGWTASAILVTALQYRMPTPWNMLSTECIDILAFGNYLASTNIATEVLLVLVPLAIWTRETPVGNRLYVSAVSWSRLSIIAAVSVQLYFFNSWVASPSIEESWSVSMCMQIAQTLSVVSVCLATSGCKSGKDMSTILSRHTEIDGPEPRWDARKSGSLSYSHIPQRSIDWNNPLELVISPYCRPLATHGRVRSSASFDSYNFLRIPSNIALPLSTPEPPLNVFNRLIRSSSSLDLDPLGTPRNLEKLGCLPPPDWENEETEELEEQAQSGRVSPERQPTSEYVSQRSRVISVPEERSMFEMGGEWNGFVPPLPTPKPFDNPPRAF